MSLIAAVVGTLGRLFCAKNSLAKVRRPAPDLGVLPVVPVHKVNLAGLIPAMGRRIFSPFSSSTYSHPGLRKPCALFVRAHGQQDMGVGLPPPVSCRLKSAIMPLKQIERNNAPHKAGLFLSGQLHGQGDLHLPHASWALWIFFGKLHAVPLGVLRSEKRAAMCRKQYFRMDNALFHCSRGSDRPTRSSTFRRFGRRLRLQRLPFPG